MPQDVSTTCQLCLRADDPDSMLAVHIQQANIEKAMEYLFCRDCAFTIAEAVKLSDEAPPAREPVKEQEPPKPRRNHSQDSPKD